MNSELRPCGSCHRHVRGDGPCPFCGDGSERPAVGGALPGRHGRAVRFVLGAALVASAATGCGSSSVPDPDGGAEVDAGLAMPYGCPPLLEAIV